MISEQEQSANFSRLPFTSLTSTLSKSAQVTTFEAAHSSVLIKHLCACISSSIALSGNSCRFSLSQQWHSEVKTKTLLQSASCRLRCLSILLRLQLLQSFSPLWWSWSSLKVHHSLSTVQMSDQTECTIICTDCLNHQPDGARKRSQPTPLPTHSTSIERVDWRGKK